MRNSCPFTPPRITISENNGNILILLRKKPIDPKKHGKTKAQTYEKPVMELIEMTEEGKVLLEKPLKGAEEIKTTIKTEQKKL